MELKQLVHELISISVIHRCRITKSASKVGLYFGQPMIIQYISDHDRCSQKELAKALHISPASAAVSLKRIEKAGFIIRSQDEKDSRKNHLSVTKKGLDAVREFHKICKTTDEEMFRGFSEEERETLHSLLKRLHKNLDSESFSAEEIDSLLKKSQPSKGASKKI